MTFFECEIYEYSTTVTQRVEELARLGHYPKSSYAVPSFTLGELIRKSGLSSAELLCIDVEGMELDVLRGNSWDLFHPKLIVVQKWNSPMKKPTDVFAFLTGMGYSLVAFDIASSFYMRQD